MIQPRTTVAHNKSYWTSDWHLSHMNAIIYDKRPFTTTEEMDQTIINNFSSLKEDDHLFFLGDLAFVKNPLQVVEMLKPIKCKMYWVIGNHDTPLLKCKELTDRFQWVLPQAEIYVTEPNVPKQRIVLNHFAMKVWNKSHYGSWHLYGHSHHTLEEDINSFSFDVGANGWDYKPVTYDIVKGKMADKIFIPIDHHTSERE